MTAAASNSPGSAAGEDIARGLLRIAGVDSIAILTADAETFVSFRGHLVEALVGQGIAVTYIGPAVDAETRTWLATRGVRIATIPIHRNSLTPLADLRTAFSLWRALLETRPKAVIATRVKTTAYGLIAAVLAGVPYRFVFVTGLGYAFTERLGDRRWGIVNRVARTLYRVGLRHASAVAFQNADDERDFRSAGIVPVGVPSTVVHGSGVDTDYFHETPLPERLNCLFVGRLLKDKGLGEFIDAARSVRARRPDITFTVLGPAETNPAAYSLDLLRAAAEEGVIEYAGNVGDVRPLIARCRIFVLPSYREGTPRSILEAMSMGRPIITTDVPGCRDTVEPGRNGILVPARDPVRLAEAILALADDPVLSARMGRESRELAERKYDVHQVTKALLSFFAASVRDRNA